MIEKRAVLTRLRCSLGIIEHCKLRHYLWKHSNAPSVYCNKSNWWWAIRAYRYSNDLYRESRDRALLHWQSSKECAAKNNIKRSISRSKGRHPLITVKYVFRQLLFFSVIFFAFYTFMTFS